MYLYTNTEIKELQEGMDYREQFNFWLEDDYFDEETKKGNIRGMIRCSLLILFVWK